MRPPAPVAGAFQAIPVSDEETAAKILGTPHSRHS